MTGSDKTQAALTLVSGPAASGKSRWAEHLAAESGLAVTYLATGPSLPEDAAWQRRLERHRRRRPPQWQVAEVGEGLAEALDGLELSQLGLVDSLGTWVAAHLDRDGPAWRACVEELLASIASCRGPLVVVCEETGWGVVPPTREGLRFRERLGALQRQVSFGSDAVWLVAHGRAIELSRLGHIVPEDD